jgi:HK97 family phage major capsid protein
MADLNVQETANETTEVVESKTVTMTEAEFAKYLEQATEKGKEKANEMKVSEKAKLPAMAVENEDSRSKLNKSMRKFIQMSKAGNIEGTASSGATVGVPVEFAKELAKLLSDAGVVRKYAKVVPMNGMKLTFNTLATQANPSWNGQAVAKDTTSDTFSAVTLTRNTLAFIKPVSNELIQDGSFDIVAELLEISKNAIAREEDKQGFVGVGAPITGVTVASGTNEVELTGTIAQGALTYQKIVDMIYASSAPKTGNEKLYMHRSVWAKVRGLEDSGGTLIGVGQKMGEENFEGTPVVFVEDMTSVAQDGTNKALMVYGDLKNVYMGVRDDFNVSFSEHATVNGESMFETNQTAFRFEEAVDIAVVHPSAFSVLKTAH